MIDWHSHILPGMDDGSQNVEESLSMLDALRDQDVECVVATPHFYANDESVDEFLQRRQKAYLLLTESMKDDHPRLFCGAEVRYYPGIAKMSELDKLKIESSNYLLLEMPMGRWTEYTIRELMELANMGSLTVILAHVDRYLAFQSPTVWEKLSENGLLMQVNATAFNGYTTRHKVLKMFENGMVQFIGSDCHNLTSRPPKIAKAYETIQKKFGEYYLSKMNEYGFKILGQNL